MENKEAYKKKMQAQLREWGAVIDQLRAKADKKTASTEIDYNKTINNLKDKKEKTLSKLNSVKDTNEGSWQNFKAEVESNFEDLKKSIDKAIEKIK